MTSFRCSVLSYHQMVLNPPRCCVFQLLKNAVCRTYQEIHHITKWIQESPLPEEKVDSCVEPSYWCEGRCSPRVTEKSPLTFLGSGNVHQSKNKWHNIEKKNVGKSGFTPLLKCGRSTSTDYQYNFQTFAFDFHTNVAGFELQPRGPNAATQCSATAVWRHKTTKSRAGIWWGFFFFLNRISVLNRAHIVISAVQALLILPRGPFASLALNLSLIYINKVRRKSALRCLWSAFSCRSFESFAGKIHQDKCGSGRRRPTVPPTCPHLHPLDNTASGACKGPDVGVVLVTVRYTLLDLWVLGPFV